MNFLRFEELTALKIEKFVKENRVIMLTFGSIEQHSTHLPVGTDYLCIYKRVEEIAKKTKAIIFSPLELGYSFNHMGMLGTVSLSAKLFIDIVVCILKQLFSQGWKRFLIFSGHNGNWSALKVAVQIAKEEFPNVQVVFADTHPRMSDEHRKTRFVRNFDYHAGLVETSIVSYYYKELIDRDNIPCTNSNIPIIINKLRERNKLDDIDMLLFSAFIPQHTVNLSNNGMWGINDPHAYGEVQVKDAMTFYIDFYVELLMRWDELVI